MPGPRIKPASEVVARIAATALALPDAYEEGAWTGVRWRVRGRTCADVLVAQEGYRSSYRAATGVTAPTTVLTFRSLGEEQLALGTRRSSLLRPGLVRHHHAHGARGRYRLGRGGRAGR